MRYPCAFAFAFVHQMNTHEPTNLLNETQRGGSASSAGVRPHGGFQANRRQPGPAQCQRVSCVSLIFEQTIIICRPGLHVDDRLIVKYPSQDYLEASTALVMLTKKYSVCWLNSFSLGGLLILF